MNALVYCDDVEEYQTATIDPDGYLICDTCGSTEHREIL